MVKKKVPKSLTSFNKQRHMPSFFLGGRSIHHSLEQSPQNRLSTRNQDILIYLATVTVTSSITAPSTNGLPESGWGGLLQYPGLSDCSWHMVIRAGILITFPTKMKGRG